MSDLTKLNITELKVGLSKGEISSVELTKAYLKEIEAQKDLNAYITVTADLAIKQAELADKNIKSGTAKSLEGIPLGIKDLYCTKGVLTTAASHILDGFIPEYESTVTKKLLEAGAVMLGKTNLDEFAMGSSNITSYYGVVKNPLKKKDLSEDLVPGGSSGGSAAAVAGFLCAGATGTDTGGSIRQPAAFCGITGIKPTYGRCSRWGIVAYASSLDQAGPMAKTVRDNAIMLGVMAGFDEKDSTSAPIEVPDFEKAITGNIKGLKIGIPKEFHSEGLDADITKYWEKAAGVLKAQGAEIVEVSIPHLKYSVPTYYVLAPAEASSNLARYDGIRFGLREAGETLDELYMNTRGKGFGKEVRRRILTGTYVLSAGYYDAYYLKAQKVRRLIYNDFLKAFEKCDVMLTPTTPTTAFGLKEGEKKDPVSMYLNDIYSIPINLAGLPAMSLPFGKDKSELPIGLQLIGKHFDEETIFKVGDVLEHSKED